MASSSFCDIDWVRTILLSTNILPCGGISTVPTTGNYYGPFDIWNNCYGSNLGTWPPEIGGEAVCPALSKGINLPLMSSWIRLLMSW